MPKDRCPVCDTEKIPDTRLRITTYIRNPLGKDMTISQSLFVDRLEDLQGGLKKMEKRLFSFIGELRDGKKD